MTVSAEKTYLDHVFTLDELDYWLAHPEQFFLPEHFEVIEGKIVEVMSTQEPHGDVGVNIILLLGNYVRANRLGKIISIEVGFKLREEPLLIRNPDVAFMGRARVKPNNKGFIGGAPDLAIEILSPSNTDAEMSRKVEEYLTYGARLVWLVDPEAKEVKIHRLNEANVVTMKDEDEITGEGVIEGFSCRVSEFFQVDTFE